MLNKSLELNDWEKSFKERLREHFNVLDFEVFQGDTSEFVTRGVVEWDEKKLEWAFSQPERLNKITIEAAFKVTINRIVWDFKRVDYR